MAYLKVHVSWILQISEDVDCWCWRYHPPPATTIKIEKEKSLNVAFTLSNGDSNSSASLWGEKDHSLIIGIAIYC